MARTASESQRLYRQRLKEKEKQASLSVDDVFQTPFFEFWQGSDSQNDLDTALGLAGINAPYFKDDRPPEAFVFPHIVEGLDNEHDPFGRLETASGQGSLPRAEIMIGLFWDAARVLAEAVNDYKRREIKARMAEIEGSDLSEPAAKKAALQEAARLNKMLDQLDKQVRWTFPQWKVTG